MAVPSLVQEVSTTFSSTNFVVEVPAVSSGSVLLVTLGQTGSQSTFAWGIPTEGLGNTFSSIVSRIDSTVFRTIGCWYAKNIVGGSTTRLTFVSTAVAIQGVVHIVEIAGADPSTPLDTFGTNVDAASQSTHSGSSGLNTAANVFVYLASVFNAAHGNTTPPAGYSTFTVPASFCAMYSTSASSKTADVGAFTTGTARTGAQVMVSVTGTAGAAVTMRSPWRMRLMGAGRV